MRATSKIRLVLGPAAILIALTACSSGASTTANDPAPSGGTVDAEAIDACTLFTPAEIQTAVEANLEAFGAHEDIEITSVTDGVPDDTPIGDCKWDVKGTDHSDTKRCEQHMRQNRLEPGPGDCPAGKRTLFVRINVYNTDEDEHGLCLVLYRGVCASAGRVGDDPFILPESVAAAVRARIDEA